MNKSKRFKVTPSNVNMNRSTFDIGMNHKFTGNFGDIIPFYWAEILPGDTFNVDTQLFSRMSTPLYPVMDNAWIDYYYFFVPNRLVWSHWAEFLGENKYTAWVSDTEYIIPHASVVPEVGSVYDYLGLPVYSDKRYSFDIGFLLPRMYHLIYNEWFRNENTTDPILVNTGDDVSTAEVARFQSLCKASKPFDQFTSALPAPQKGDPVDIPLTGNAPVITGEDHNLADIALRFKPSAYIGTDTQWVQFFLNKTSDDKLVARGAQHGVDYPSSEYEETNLAPANLYADLSAVTGVTINQLRQAFQMQRLLELQARSGSRYTEIIKASFGVTSPDARLQRPEYLGGSRVQIQMQQVAQTSATNDESPLGKVGAYSKTVTASRDFNHSFTEHGFIVGVAVARHALTYQQGLDRMWSRRGRFDLYWPTFAHLGEQPIYQKELFAQGDADEDNKVFGYQEAWYEYRYMPNRVSGMFRSTVDGNLDEWHYADYYEDAPILSDGWMNATGTTVDRTLAVSSDVHHQLLFDVNVNATATRVMPLYSVPGMVDHF